MRSSYRPWAVLLTTLLLAISSLLSTTWGATPPSPAAPGGADKSVPRGPSAPSPTLAIPGPLQPFLRLAAVSRKVTPEEVLPLLSHQVVLDGYGGSSRSSSPTEYLILVRRYVDQARELQALADPDGNIRVANCDGAQRLLSVIGYRLRQPCGPNATLETANSKRAFTTVDSGFPLADLEKALQDGKPFVYPFSSTQLPVLFDSGVWMENDRNKNHKDCWTRSWAMRRWPVFTGRSLRLTKKRVLPCGFLRASRGSFPSRPNWISMANNCAFDQGACWSPADRRPNPHGNIW